MARSPERLNELLGEDGVAVCDGAMGTMLYARGVFVNRSFDELNLSNPELVRSVHREYVAAGADLIETNTFSANRFKLAPHGCEDLVLPINVQGVRLAREAAGPDTLVAGSIGPLGVRIEPYGPVSVEEARAAFAEQARALLEGEAGVDLFFLETFYHLPELEQAVRAVRELTDRPIVALVTVTEQGVTPEGVPPEAFGRTLAGWEIDALGVNCGAGPAAALEAIEALRAAVDLPIAAQPNAGQPRNVNGRNMYLTSPEYLASYARRFVKAGARLVGGCCGTQPEHVRAIKQAIVAARPDARLPRQAAAAPASAAQVPVPAAERSLLARHLAERAFPVCVQVEAPLGSDPGPALERVRALREGGVELIAVPERIGGTRMAAQAAAYLCQREAGAEALVELSCRQRTLLQLQSEVLAVSALGVRNLVLVTGPPPAIGEYPDATANLEVDSIGLTNMVRRLNQGVDLAGRPLDRPTAIHIGVHLDPFALDLDHEIRRFEWKVDAGAEFALTPPVLDPEALAEFLPRIAHCRIPIVASVPLLRSHRDAERLRRETGAGRGREDDIERLLRAESEGRALEVGIEITRSVLAAIRPLVEGVQLVVHQGDPRDALRVL